MDQEFPGPDFTGRAPALFPPAFATTWGDDRYGLWAEFEIPAVESRHGTAAQRLRWIESGTFLMGSPEKERERYGDEGPQHAVMLTRGFWLADTACTQALWRAVMGETSSRSEGEDRPVASVSWDAVQDFLRRLQVLLPGNSADLPTEAEWEYACRAGTPDPFSFGATITTDQANYNGGPKGEYREETVPVKSLPANPWGLYEMHGNVWEWCADGPRTYDGEAQTDPRGPDGGGPLRAVRGGSWIIDAGGVRSAYRFADHPGDADGGLGFRLSLRSIESGSVDRGWPGGSASGVSGRRPAASSRDEAKPPQNSDSAGVLPRR